MTSGIKPCERCHVVPGERWDTFYTVPPCGTVAEIEASGKESDCVGCHMSAVVRPAAAGAVRRPGRRHTFAGGHDPEQVKKALNVEYEKRANGRYRFVLTNTGASHYLPTGTPDRHLTLELHVRDSQGAVLKEQTHTLKRYILWRPFIMDLWDSRLPYGVPRVYDLSFSARGSRQPALLEVTVRYHLLDEARRKRIGYQNIEPIAYPIYRDVIPIAQSKDKN